ncbi:MAG: hypothetical protein ABSG84_06845 [Acidobacteriaceae bacterium]|jgi:hypothetical protein
MSLDRFTTSGLPLFAAILILGSSIAAAQQPPASTSSGPQIAGCPIFPADNVWNVPIDKLPIDPPSKAYIASIGADLGLHPDFGADPANGIPFTLTDSHVKPSKVRFGYDTDSDPGTYPIPPNPPIEGGPNPPEDGDRHILLVDKDHCMLIELYAVKRLSDTTWEAGSGIKMDLNSDKLRPNGETSADAAGLPILPGLVRYDEVASGEIRHALRFTVPKTLNGHIWPARHDASNIDDRRFPPMGLRFRLRADFDISGFSKTNQVILTALKRYGMFLADNGSAWFLSGAPDPRWNDDDLHNLLQVKGSDFEAVNETSLMSNPDSARTNPTANK